MRSFIFTRVEQLQFDNTKKKIEEIKDAFEHYLDGYPVKTIQSKHGIMGPVGKVLQEIKKGKWDKEGLSGFAINIHLHNPKTNGRISDIARAELEAGIEKLLALMQEESVTAQDRILELIDYGLYYRRKKKILGKWESIRKEWIEFLKGKYSTWEHLTKAWGEKPKKVAQSFESIGYPGKTSYASAKDQKRADMAEFIRQAELKGYDLDDEEV